MNEKRCDGCAHVDHVPGVHPMRCRPPGFGLSLPVGIMREENSQCGPKGALWEPREKYHDHDAQ